MKKNLIRPEILAAHGYSLKKQNDRVKLNQNESPYDLPLELKQKVLAHFQEAAWNRYPLPYATGLSERIAVREGWKKDGVLVAGGSNVLIQALVMATAVKGRVVTITPSFSLYELQAKLLGNKVTEVPLNTGDFSLPVEKLLKAFKKEKPALVFLPNPNAPTGNLFPEKDLLTLIKAAPGLIVIDEAYYPFSGFTMARHLKKYKNLVLLRTFSKAFSLGGARLGYLMADPKVAQEIQKIVLPFSVGILSQVLGEVILDHPEYVDGVVNESLNERAKIFQSLKGFPQLTVYPSDTNFILFQTSSKLAVMIQKSLEKAGIVIRNVSSKTLPNALRISVGSPKENEELLDVLKRTL